MPDSWPWVPSQKPHEVRVTTRADLRDDTGSWVITGADIRQVPGPAPAPAAQLGGTAYWLQGGGGWHVHGMQLQISQGPSGLTGTETWNEYGNVIMGTAHLAFTPDPDGSLSGTFTDSTSLTTTPGADTSGWPGMNPEDPKQGDTIRLVPVTRDYARVVYVSPAITGPGNYNLCAPTYVSSLICGA
jgi:hypothetical protein